VFQDPYGSPDPMFTVERLITEPLRTFEVGSKVGRAGVVWDESVSALDAGG
jgi:peptide/nickel transport system ATP-binding protein